LPAGNWNGALLLKRNGVVNWKLPGAKLLAPELLFALSANDWYKVPEIVAEAANPTGWVKPDAQQPLLFHTAGQSEPVTLAPLYTILQERYAVYWKVNNKTA
jgi:hypothetical protein